MLFAPPVGYRAVAARMDVAGVGGLFTFVFITFRSGSRTTVTVVRVNMLYGAICSLAPIVDTRRRTL